MSSNSTTNRYDKYKDSGIEWIGEIPDSWNMAKLSWCSQFINGYAFDSTQMDMDKKIPVVRIGDIQNGKVDYDNCLKVMQNDNLKSYIVKLKDIVIAMSGATTGKIATIDRTNLAYINQRVGIIRSSNNQFIKYCLENESFIKYIDLLSAGSAQPNISMGDILNFKIPYISISEQEAIAGYLDRKCVAIDETIEKQKSVIEKLKEYKQSIITQAVTKGLDKSAPMKDSGIEWIGQIPQHWEICKLLKLFKDRKFPNKGNIENNVLSLSYGNIKRRNVETNMGLLPESFESYNIIEPNNIVLRLTDLQNDHKSLRCGLVKERGIITSAYVTLELKDTSQCANYFYRLLHTFDIEKGFYGMGAGVRQSLKYDGELCNLYIIKPPVIEQKQIAEFLDKKCSEIDKTIEDKEKLIEKLVEYKKSLIYECVTGKRKEIC